MKFIKAFTTSLLATGILATSLLTTSVAHAASVNLSGAAKDCDNNAVVYCGASTASELLSKYNASSSVAQIYAHFGITAADVQALGSTAVAGSVTKSGDVLVGNTVVAKNALTAGRQNISGSTKVTENGVTFYTRTPSVSFRSSPIPAFVVMKDGVFKFAILGACGNPVIATATAKPPKTPPVTPPTTPTPPVTTTVSTPPVALPNTGPGQVVAIAAAATIVGSAAYYFVAKRRLSL